MHLTAGDGPFRPCIFSVQNRKVALKAIVEREARIRPVLTHKPLRYMGTRLYERALAGGHGSRGLHITPPLHDQTNKPATGDAVALVRTSHRFLSPRAHSTKLRRGSEMPLSPTVTTSPPGGLIRSVFFSLKSDRKMAVAATGRSVSSTCPSP